MIDIYTFDYQSHDVHAIVEDGRYWLVFDGILKEMCFNDRALSGLPDTDVRTFRWNDVSYSCGEKKTGEIVAISEYGFFLLTQLMGKGEKTSFRLWMTRVVIYSMCDLLYFNDKSCEEPEQPVDADKSNLFALKQKQDILSVKYAFAQSVLSECVSAGLIS
ncbi:hypothetical protein J7444_00590 [Labrenzia sp. R4_1]|uniref:hypothetical protein n=1 Tax=Labrenzia sp. R4_1 TaxID=2821106 RepID=UPI001ADD340C|nr:hypothetical protein [Labrenzia sp. R4_1]MBO9423193.1 hypothetical protein [Labrenzia sp. R4_1]